MTYTEIIKSFGKDIDLIDLINRQQAEIDTLTYTLLGVMHSVDKWLDGDELEQDEVNRAATMREKTLRIVEEKQEEIELWKNEYYRACAERDIRMFTTKFIRKEAIKEFAERLKEKFVNIPIIGLVASRKIDNLVKEMAGDK